MAFVVYLVVLFASLMTSLFFWVLQVDTSNVFDQVIMSVTRFAIFMIIFFVFSALMNKAEGRQIFKHYGIKKISVIDIILLVAFAAICIVTFILAHEGSIKLFELMGYNPPDPFEINNLGHLAVLIIIFAVFPAIWEELVFRGLIMGGLLKYGKATAVLISSLLFSLMHLSPAQTFYQFFFGAICAIIYLRTKNLTVPIILHFVNNALILTYTYITQSLDHAIHFNAKTIITMIVLLFGGVLVILTMARLFTKSNTPLKDEQSEKKKLFPSVELVLLVVVILISMLIWGMEFAAQPPGEY
ncbi:MAG: CPBP family intramembrane metalloprotease [Firmicutes bacterium]|nr:CPBP family intramembrane metalloprotease [Bacillota bacterium]